MSIIKKDKSIKTEHIKIYVVDDEEYYLNLTKINLNKFGYTDVTIFTSGEDCLIKIEEEKPTCIILDYLIKNGTNGDGILNIITQKYPYIDVIILSGQEDVTIATDMMKNGAYDYIVKDKMTFFNLTNTLNSILSKKTYDHKLNKSKNRYKFIIISIWIIGITSFIFYFFNK